MQAMLHDEGDDIEARIELDYDDTKIVRTFTSKKSHIAYWVNGVEKSTNASATQVKKDLQDHINVNFETMCSILLFGQHHIFSFLEAGEADRREVFENLLTLKEYNLYEERAKELRKETKKKIEILTKSHETTLTHLKSQQAMLEQQKDKFRSHVDGLNRDIARIKRDITAIPDTEGLEKAWEVYESAEKSRTSLKEQKAVLLQRINDLSQEKYQHGVSRAERLQSGRKPLDESLAAIEKKITALEAKRDGYKQEIAAQRRVAASVVDKIKNIDGDYTNRIASLSNSSVIFTLKHDIAKVGSDGRLLATKLGHIRDNTSVDVCPVCYGKVDPTNAQSVIKHHEDEIRSLRVKYTSLSNQLSAAEKQQAQDIEALKAEWENAKKGVYLEQSEMVAAADEYEQNVQAQFENRHAILANQKEIANKALSDFIKEIEQSDDLEIERIERKTQECQKELSKIEDSLRSSAPVQPSTPLHQVGALIAKKAALTKEVTEKTAALLQNPYSDIIQSLTDNVQEVQDKVDTEVGAIRAQEKLLPYYDFWVGAMGNEGIKSFIIEGILPTLNEQIDYWMQLIYQGAISVKFDKFLNVEIKNVASKKGMKRYGQGSGGERRRIDIAIMLAFRQIMKMSTGKDPNIVFFDEVAENIDEEGLAWLYNVLVDLSKASRVYVISHNPGLISLLQGGDTLSIVKKNGAATLL